MTDADDDAFARRHRSDAAFLGLHAGEGAGRFRFTVEDRLSRMDRPHLSDFHFSDFRVGRNSAHKAGDRFLAFFK